MWVRFFEPDMDARLRERERELLESELRRAVETAAVSVKYQPLLDLKTNRIIGFEALARWNNDALGGDVSPERFIPVAVEAGLVKQLTLQLLRQACDAAKTWPADIILAFNISPAELHDETLGLSVLRILGDTGLKPQRLEIEVTESAVVRDLDAAQRTLCALRAAGVRIALDGFGAGYSSLYHLKNFKVDKIKIDRSFVDNMMSAPQDADLVRAILGIGKGLCLDMTAEGIETEGRRDFLRAGGREQGQGFLFSEAIGADIAETMANAHTSRPSLSLAS